MPLRCPYLAIGLPYPHHIERFAFTEENSVPVFPGSLLWGYHAFAYPLSFNNKFAVIEFL
jgi:hypothetical protein